MKKSNLDQILLSVYTFEEFEKLKLNIEILQHVAKTRIQRHQLPDASLTLFCEGTKFLISFLSTPCSGLPRRPSGVKSGQLTSPTKSRCY